MKQTEINTISFAAEIRKKALRMVCKANTSHIGGCLSAADILASLYGWWLNIDIKDPEKPARDRFILSKGHAAAIGYAALAEIGFFSKNELEHFCEDGAKLGGHFTHTSAPGVEVSTGSLGHGLPLGVGMALGLKRDDSKSRVAVLLSDGECNSGTNWESFLLAPRLKLDNLLVIIDFNKIQALGQCEQIMPLEPFAEKLRAFRWGVQEIDGHNHAEIKNALESIPSVAESPSVIIAHTIKGKGVSFMENKLDWHYRSPNDEMLAQAISEIDQAVCKK